MRKKLYFVIAILLIILIITGSRFFVSCPIQLFILAGQSNMVGYGSNLEELPIELRESDKILWFDRENRWSSLQVPTEPLPFSYRVLNPSGGFGIEVSLGQKLSRNRKKPVAFVKYAVNGTSLADDWKPDGKLYTNAITRVQQAINSLSYTETLEIAGFFWIQGEKDALNETAAIYYERNLVQFIERIRQDLNEPQLPFIIGKIPVESQQQTRLGLDGFYPYANQVRQAQQNIIQIVTNTAVVETLDLPRIDDNLHLSSQGLIELGYRLAEAWKNVHKPRKLYFCFP